MKQKLLLIIFVSTIILITPIVNICSAEVNVTNQSTGQPIDLPSPEKIQNFIPQPLTDLFNSFSKFNIDFSQVPFFNKITDSIPKSGNEVSGLFDQLIGGLTFINNWVEVHIGLSVIAIIQKVGELFVWIFESIANLLKIGLSFIK